ncbi:hypothetical protein Ade02nite_06970 [Paractinoplanes deccanensis]|uniref:Uncharacterized protein n=1 Tax=Paractinoplanes deccanensis TaxID=113561 RepID=A0ABQ3XWD4_9ACTN|nr:hypothetical protein Ade02nite_06970 [Actinoplanes deccanensis]
MLAATVALSLGVASPAPAAGARPVDAALPTRAAAAQPVDAALPTRAAGAPPAAAASLARAAAAQPLVGSEHASGYRNGWYRSEYASGVALDLLVKHNRTILRCAPSAFSSFLPGVGPIRVLSAARALRVKDLADTVRRATLMQKVGTIAHHLSYLGGEGCAAAYRLVRSAYHIYQVGQRADYVYFADRSTWQQRATLDVCTIDVRVAEPGRTAFRHYAAYRFCGPRW